MCHRFQIHITMPGVSRMMCAQCLERIDPNHYYIIQEWDTNELATEIKLCSHRCMLGWFA